jgi:hypothetical protein
MRIAAGVLLIIASVFELLAGITWTFFGGVTATGSNIVEQAIQKAAETSKDPKAQEAAAKLGQVGTALGGGIMIYGLFLLVVFGLDIAGAVMLFREKGANFALVVGILQLLACVASLVIFTGAFILVCIPGILAGIFTIIAALGYRGKSFSALSQPQ